jgi:hypothetical protein
VPLPELGEVHGREPAFGRTHEQVAQLLAQATQAERLGGEVRRQLQRRTLPLQVTSQQLGQHQILLRP